MRMIIPLFFLSFLSFADAAPEPLAFSATTSQATWTLTMEGGPLLVIRPLKGGASHSARLVMADGDPEIRELPDGTAVPAATYRGELGDCSVSVDVALGNERAWISLHDCVPDAPLPGGWTGLLSLSPAASPAWQGAWTMTSNGTDASLDITHEGGGLLRVVGLATRQVNAASIHFAEFDITNRPVDGRLVLDAAENDSTIERDSACTVTLSLTDTTLTADDNGRCGGRGVSFDGIYTRRKK